MGPVEVRVDGRVVELGRPQQRLLVAALAVDAGRPVSVDTLVGRIWDEAPSDPVRNVHVLVSRLRQVLEQASAAGEAVPVVRRSGGYVLDVDPQQVDLLRYRGLIAQARRDASDTERVRLLRQALGLWRGDPLAGLTGQWATRTALSWRRQHVDVVVAWAWAEILTGNPGAVVGPLTELAEEHPLTESLIEVLMPALAATGRSADALAVYRNIRQRLADELGTDPGLALQEAQQQILRGQQRGQLGPSPMAPPTVATPEPVMTRPWLAGVTYVGGPASDPIVLTDLRVEHAIVHRDGGAGFRSTPAAEVQQDAATALRGAHSVHVRGTILSHGESARLDVRMQGGMSSGAVMWKGSQFEITIVGLAFYLKGDQSAWLGLQAPPAVEGFAGRWVKLRIDQVDFGVVSLDALVGSLMDKAWRTDAQVEHAMLDGTKVVVLIQPNGSKLYVASTGPPYPLRLHKPDGTQLDFTEHGVDFRLAAPDDALLNELTAAESAWLDAIKNLFEAMNDIFRRRIPTHLTAAAFTSLSDKLRGCRRELARIGTPSERLQPVYALVQRACVRYDRGAECFAIAADLAGRYVGPHTEQRMDEAVDGGFAASAASDDLLDAMNKGDEIGAQLSLTPRRNERHRSLF